MTDATSSASSFTSRESPDLSSTKNTNTKSNTNSNDAIMSSAEKYTPKAKIKQHAADIPPPPPPPPPPPLPPLLPSTTTMHNSNPSPMITKSPSKSPKILKVSGPLPSLPLLPSPGIIVASSATANNHNAAGGGGSQSPNINSSSSSNANNVNVSTNSNSSVTANATNATNTLNSNVTTNNNNNNNNNSNSSSTATATYPLLVEIQQGTPAAEALKANADVRVSALHKFARSTKSQAVVRALKSAARTASGQPCHAGDRRGAPPFVAPKSGATGGAATAGAGAGGVGGSSGRGASAPPTIPETDDEGDSQSGHHVARDDESFSKMKKNMATAGAAAGAAASEEDGDGSVEVIRDVQVQQLSSSGDNDNDENDNDNNNNNNISSKSNNDETDNDDSTTSSNQQSLTIDNLGDDDESGVGAASTPDGSGAKLVPSLLFASHSGGGGGATGGASFRQTYPTSFLQQQQHQQQHHQHHHQQHHHQQQQHHHSFAHVTHAALPAAIAAACRAGEDMDRKRATNIIATQHNQIDHGGANAGLTTSAPPSIAHGRLSSLFKSSPAITTSPKTFEGDHKEIATPTPAFIAASMGGATTALPPISIRGTSYQRRRSPSDVSNKSSASYGVFQSTAIPVFRRYSSSSSYIDSSLNGGQILPSEISCAETEVHANIGNDLLNEVDDLSDEELEDNNDTATEVILSPGEMLSAASALPGHILLKKTRIDPVVVVVPEDVPQEDSEIEGIGEEEDAQLSASKIKKKKKSFKKKMKEEEEDSFHFHGPKSVAKWVRRRRHKEKDKIQRSYVKGKVIDGQHELYTMSIAVMLGMRTSIGRTNMRMAETSHNERRWLDNDDFMAVEKYVFRPRGTDITPPHQLSHTFKFKDYSPLAFAYLRRMFGVNEYEFLLSVCGNANYIEFQSNAKSGQFFFYSPDGKYMIKTMTNAESKFLRRILPHYFRHCAKNPNTLIAKFLGMYRVKLYHLRRNVKFMVMKSVYDTDKHLHQLFDVKGSTTGRDAKPGDAVKKDNDLRRVLPDGAFALEPCLRDRLKEQVVLDTQWLSTMKIMDYSMLIGVHNIPHRPSQKIERPAGHRRTISNSNTPNKANLQPSTRSYVHDDGEELSHSSFDASHATLDQFLDDDDDGSYLDGAQNNRCRKSRVANESLSASDDKIMTPVRVKKSSYIDDESSKKVNAESDALLEKAIEDMYWPFHRFYDIQGRRRLNPIPEYLVVDKRQETNVKQSAQLQKDESTTEHVTDLDKNELPTFERPLSNRKDSGFMMHLANVEMPIKLTQPGAPHMVELCDGKIFYMGIIDILQQFNTRKRFEARYRRLGGKGWEAASCVHPHMYADRFLRFFDEYSQREPATTETGATNAPVSDGNLPQIPF